MQPTWVDQALRPTQQLQEQVQFHSRLPSDGLKCPELQFAMKRHNHTVAIRVAQLQMAPLLTCSDESRSLQSARNVIPRHPGHSGWCQASSTPPNCNFNRRNDGWGRNGKFRRILEVKFEGLLQIGERLFERLPLTRNVHLEALRNEEIVIACNGGCESHPVFTGSGLRGRHSINIAMVL